MRRYEVEELNAYIDAVLQGDPAAADLAPAVGAETARIVHGLDLLSQSVSASISPRVEFAMELQARLDRQLASQAARRRNAGPARFFVRPRWLPARAAVLAAVLIILALLVGVAYAVAPLLMDIWQHNAMTNVEREGLAQELNLSQTVNGVTVTLERAYADANRIVIGYTCSSPGQPSGDVCDVGSVANLTDSAGRSYRPLSGLMGRGGAEQLAAHVLNFDGADLPPGTSSATFHLAVIQITAGKDGTGDAEGAWVFDFTLPVVPGRIAEVGQEATASEVTVRLDRVVVTPSEVRAYLRFTPPAVEADERWSPIAGVAVAGYTSRGSESWRSQVVSLQVVEKPPLLLSRIRHLGAYQFPGRFC